MNFSLFAVEVYAKNILNKISKNAKYAFYKMHFLSPSQIVRLDLKPHLERFLLIVLNNAAKHWSTKADD